MMSHTTNISSYPPVFRPTHHHPTPVNAPSDHHRPDPLPIIDTSCLDEARLHEVCSEWGIFRVVNHGVPERLTARLHAAAKSLFDLGFESKRALFKGPINPVYSWGNPALTPAGVETPKRVPEVGLEIMSFKVSQRRMCSGGADTTCAVAEEVEASIAAFRTILEEYGEHMTRLARGLFEAMARNLKLDQNLLAQGDSNKFLDESSGLLRVNRYPPYSTSDTDPQVKGLHAHTDSTVLTILLQDEVYGLEFLRDGLWLPVKPVPNTLIVNLGDMLQAMSDDKYKSVEHKVTLNKQRERISVGYFVFPEENTLIVGSKGKYRPFTYKDFRTQVQDDVAKIGRKVGLSRFRA